MMKKLKALVFFLFASQLIQAQLGFCPGSKGIPIFFENFGSGTDQGPALAPGTITYTYSTGMPTDGEYNLYYHTNLSASWHNSLDHTPDTEPDGFNGKSLIINAGLTPAAFYRKVVSGLCVNTTFEFSAWIMNLYDTDSGSCSGTGRPVDVTFEIWNAAETAILASGTTGLIAGTANPIWTQYAIVFTMPAGQTGVILKMRNNGVGGCGNDLALDDISFSACGDVVTITSPTQTAPSVYQSQCVSNSAVSLVLNANTLSTIPQAYQWQESTNNSTWSDILGATSSSYTTPGLLTNHYYRARVAQDAANLTNISCSTLSNVFSVLFEAKPLPPISNGDQTICSNEAIPALSVTVGAVGETVNWYAAPSGGLPLASNTLTYSPTVSGTYYAEAHTANCKSDTRTPVKLTIRAGIVLPDDQIFHLCTGDTAILNAGANNVSYLWQPNGETTSSITVSGTGVYNVTATTADGCSDIRTFYVYTHEVPIIAGVTIDDTTVTVITQGDPFYLYSLDGNSYQSSNMFFNVPGGLHTVYVKDISLCGTDNFDFLLIVIPKYFTPNEDTYHDYWEIEGMAYLPGAKVAIFDRYGKLITMLTAAQPRWDGRYNGHDLPSTDYWFHFIRTDAPDQWGHFAMKR